MELSLSSVLLITLLHFLLGVSPSESLSGNEIDYLALLAIKSGISADPLGILNSSWNPTVHFCRWPGVACSRRDQRVTGLNLTGWNLGGSLSPRIANLSFLEKMDLSVNNFRGSIPEEFGRLTRLQILNLSVNSLEGKLPDNLSYCSEMRVLDAKNNRISGNIPAGFGSLFKLVQFIMEKNRLSGRIPASLGNVSSLTHILLIVNNLQGRVPEEIGRIANLRQLNVGVNLLSGTIPDSIYNLSSIDLFSVVDNDLEGRLPPGLGTGFPKLQVFAAGMNRFTGPIPVSLSNASGLLQADFGYNNFTGSVPKNLGVLQSLSFLSFAYNQLGSWGEDDDLGFLIDLTNCSRMETLPLGNNRFGGEVPKSIGNFSTVLKYLNLGVNQIEGIIPREIENLVGMTELDLQQNRFTGDIPSGIGKLFKLEELDFSVNTISGRIPDSFGNLTRLSRLQLFKNNLEGSIPPSLGNLTSLAELDLSKNHLNGTIPKNLFNLVSLSENLALSSNLFTGSLPLEVGQLVNLGVLSLSGNLFSGAIPSTLGSCIRLEYIYMARNFFQGPIPSSLTELKAVLEIDFSSNNLSGEIPVYFQEFSALRYLNLSFNNLEGEVPTEGVFRNASGIGVVGNRKLCSWNSRLNLPPCHREAEGKRRRSFPLKAIIVSCSVAAVLLFITPVSIIYWKRKRRSRSTPAVAMTALEEPFFHVSFAELFRATDGFSPSNLIGAGSYGSVYKGVLEQYYQTTVAIKVLNLQRKGALRSFLSECEALRNIRHRNLLKILTACSSLDFDGNDFKALVYEFMPNGSLENWLRPRPRDDDDETTKGRRSYLTFLQRLEIAIGVAHAMDYLHQQSHETIVHCDLKPSNILLDDELNAHVGDFGVAKILSEANYSGTDHSRSLNSTTTGIQGSIGYVAPEYGMGAGASTEGDVYSYGILLLEMFTGKGPIDEIFEDGENLHQYVRTALRESELRNVDTQGLLADGHSRVQDDENLSRMEECLVRVLDLGVLCSAESPKERPEMEKIVVEMLKIRDFLVT